MGFFFCNLLRRALGNWKDCTETESFCIQYLQHNFFLSATLSFWSKSWNISKGRATEGKPHVAKYCGYSQPSGAWMETNQAGFRSSIAVSPAGCELASSQTTLAQGSQHFSQPLSLTALSSILYSLYLLIAWFTYTFYYHVPAWSVWPHYYITMARQQLTGPFSNCNTYNIILWESSPQDFHTIAL